MNVQFRPQHEFRHGFVFHVLVWLIYAVNVRISDTLLAAGIASNVKYITFPNVARIYIHKAFKALRIP